MAAMSTTIRVVAHLVALPEKVEELRSVLIALVEPTRREDGCIHYELLQNQEEPTDFAFIEEWQSEAFLTAHLASDHVQDVDASLDRLLASSPDIRLYHLLA